MYFDWMMGMEELARLPALLLVSSVLFSGAVCSHVFFYISNISRKKNYSMIDVDSSSLSLSHMYIYKYIYLFFPLFPM